MNKILTFLQMLAMAAFSACAKPAERPVDSANITSSMPVYDISLMDLEGKSFDLHTLKGKYVLIVNTASECGYTPQYADLQKLQDTHGDRLTVLGFPCNQFGGQEPGTSEQIQSFCSKNYNVTFPMFQKCDVKGKGKSDLYQWLTDKSLNGWNDQEPTWNFCKYLLNPEGQLIGFYPSSVNPLDDKIISKLK